VRFTLKQLRAAAARNEPWAIDALATAISPSQPAEALRLYRKAVSKGNATAAFNLAVDYQNRGQHRRAVAWFRKAAAMGAVDALLPLAEAELQGIGTRRNTRGALQKLRRIANVRGPSVSQFDKWRAMTRIAGVLLEGWLVRRDYAGAVKWLRRAAKAGSETAKGLIADLD
jgi:uncharacterized protein